MKRRQRKPVLDVNGGESDSPRRDPLVPRSSHQQQQHLNQHHHHHQQQQQQQQQPPPRNGANPLAKLVGQYESDSEDDLAHRPRVHKLNDQLDHFLKEIQSIAPGQTSNSHDSAMPHPASYWQECYDEQTGYPYYWHTETNQVTWEIPPELKVFREKSQTSGSHIGQWPDAPSDSQSNIPDGMIPKEVVVRNRNRQAGIVNKPAKPPAKTDAFKSPAHKKHDSSDEGKIEMITSFGNDESESEESEHEEQAEQKKPLQSCLKKSSLKFPTPEAAVNSKASDSKESKTPIGPALPPIQYGPRNQEKLSDKLSQNVQTAKTSSTNKDSENDILLRLKSQAKLLQQEGVNIQNDNCSSGKLSKDSMMSLVPGYEDDSDGEDETSSKSKRNVASKPLFPIPESSSTEVKRIETGSASIKIYDYRNQETTVTVTTPSEQNMEQEDSNKSSIEDKQLPEEGKVDLESKANKFLDSIETPAKGFQRKKRIAFDVAPNKTKLRDPADTPTLPLTSSSISTGGIERSGLGFSQDEPSSDDNGIKNEYFENKKPTIAFVKATTVEGDSSQNAASPAAKTKEINETEKIEMKVLTEPIMEKLKFLSEGSPAASAVQVMAIQIQTLLSAWEAGVLQEAYLRNWLVGTGCELTRLEQTAAPVGWECQWDRTHKRYYYRNCATGEAQWTYPQSDIAGGTEEMELCTTPPPPEHEEVPIIEMSTQPAPEDSSTKSSESEQQQQQQQQDQTVPAPPPPTISSPSPPPPPRICAEDLKRGQKRKSTPEPCDDNTKGEEGSRGGEGKPVMEPLPPGVDPPEMAYALEAAAAGMQINYAAQQINPIYAATLANAAGIPIISHHHHHHHSHAHSHPHAHTAIMQGQLMHYNPAYHQHLHNQALVAARLSGQEAMQLMVAAEYARVYENNQVIAKPPVKMPHETSLGSQINSFYSDIASIEKTAADIEREKDIRLVETSSLPVLQLPSIETDPTEANKEKRKKKLKTGIGKKQKEMSSMVAKWQMAQKNYKEGN